MTTTAPTTTTPPADPVVQDVTEVSAAVKVVLAAIAVLVPGAGVALAVVGALVALAPIEAPEVEKIIALIEGKTAAPVTPLAPQVIADTAALEQALQTPIASGSAK